MEANNMKAMREALENCANMGEQIDYQLGSSDETVYSFRHERSLGHNISECARAALAKPARNCDVGTAEEQAERYSRYCDQFIRGGLHCEKCPCCGKIPFGRCEFAWMQMPYKEGGAK